MPDMQKLFSLTTAFLPKDDEPVVKRYLVLFAISYLITLGSYAVSFLIFPLQSGIISVFLTSFALIAMSEAILEKNKNDIWQKRTSPFTANLDTAVAYSIMFVGIMCAYIFIVMAVAGDMTEKLFFPQVHDTMTHTHLVNTDFMSILSKRLTVGLIFFFMAFVFKIGSNFILVWIASVWGVVYGVYFKNGFSLDLPTYKHYLVVVGASGFGVLILRTFGFITAGMAGVFFSKAFAKYPFVSSQFRQVFQAVATLLIISLSLLMLSIFAEYQMHHV